MKSKELGLNPSKIGICGFSAGGNLALISALLPESEKEIGGISGMPDFTGLFYPWFREDYSQLLKNRLDSKSKVKGISPIFMMNAHDDQMTPADKCVEFYTTLLKAGVKTELHIFGKGAHGFDLGGAGRGKSSALWPESFVAWLYDLGLIQ